MPVSSEKIKYHFIYLQTRQNKYLHCIQDAMHSLSFKNPQRILDHVAGYESRLTPFCLILCCRFYLYCSGEQIVPRETSDGGENNQIQFLYLGHNCKQDSEYLGSCDLKDDLNQVLIVLLISLMFICLYEKKLCLYDIPHYSLVLSLSNNQELVYYKF